MGSAGPSLYPSGSTTAYGTGCGIKSVLKSPRTSSDAHEGKEASSRNPSSFSMHGVYLIRCSADERDVGTDAGAILEELVLEISLEQPVLRFHANLCADHKE
jgi:endonuclease IV